MDTEISIDPQPKFSSSTRYLEEWKKKETWTGDVSHFVSLIREIEVGESMMPAVAEFASYVLFGRKNKGFKFNSEEQKRFFLEICENNEGGTIKIKKSKQADKPEGFDLMDLAKALEDHATRAETGTSTTTNVVEGVGATAESGMRDRIKEIFPIRVGKNYVHQFTHIFLDTKDFKTDRELALYFNTNIRNGLGKKLYYLVNGSKNVRAGGEGFSLPTFAEWELFKDVWEKFVSEEKRANATADEKAKIIINTVSPALDKFISEYVSLKDGVMYRGYEAILNDPAGIQFLQQAVVDTNRIPELGQIVDLDFQESVSVVFNGSHEFDIKGKSSKKDYSDFQKGRVAPKNKEQLLKAMVLAKVESYISTKEQARFEGRKILNSLRQITSGVISGGALVGTLGLSQTNFTQRQIDRIRQLTGSLEGTDSRDARILLAQIRNLKREVLCLQEFNIKNPTSWRDSLSISINKWHTNYDNLSLLEKTKYNTVYSSLAALAFLSFAPAALAKSTLIGTGGLHGTGVGGWTLLQSSVSPLLRFFSALSKEKAKGNDKALSKASQQALMQFGISMGMGITAAPIISDTTRDLWGTIFNINSANAQGETGLKQNGAEGKYVRRFSAWIGGKVLGEGEPTMTLEQSKLFMERINSNPTRVTAAELNKISDISASMLTLNAFTQIPTESLEMMDKQVFLTVPAGYFGALEIDKIIKLQTKLVEYLYQKSESERGVALSRIINGKQEVLNIFNQKSGQVGFSNKNIIDGLLPNDEKSAGRMLEIAGIKKDATGGKYVFEKGLNGKVQIIVPRAPVTDNEIISYLKLSNFKDLARTFADLPKDLQTPVKGSALILRDLNILKDRISRGGVTSRNISNLLIEIERQKSVLEKFLQDVSTKDLSKSQTVRGISNAILRANAEFEQGVRLLQAELNKVSYVAPAAQGRAEPVINTPYNSRSPGIPTPATGGTALSVPDTTGSSSNMGIESFKTYGTKEIFALPNLENIELNVKRALVETLNKDQARDLIIKLGQNPAALKEFTKLDVSRGFLRSNTNVLQALLDKHFPDQGGETVIVDSVTGVTTQVENGPSPRAKLLQEANLKFENGNFTHIRDVRYVFSLTKGMLPVEELERRGFRVGMYQNMGEKLRGTVNNADHYLSLINAPRINQFKVILSSVDKIKDPELKRFAVDVLDRTKELSQSLLKIKQGTTPEGKQIFSLSINDQEGLELQLLLLESRALQAQNLFMTKLRQLGIDLRDPNPVIPKSVLDVGQTSPPSPVLPPVSASRSVPQPTQVSQPSQAPRSAIEFFDDIHNTRMGIVEKNLNQNTPIDSGAISKAFGNQKDGIPNVSGRKSNGVPISDKMIERSAMTMLPALEARQVMLGKFIGLHGKIFDYQKTGPYTNEQIVNLLAPSHPQKVLADQLIKAHNDLIISRGKINSPQGVPDSPQEVAKKSKTFLTALYNFEKNYKPGLASVAQVPSPVAVPHSETESETGPRTVRVPRTSPADVTATGRSETNTGRTSNIVSRVEGKFSGRIFFDSGFSGQNKIYSPGSVVYTTDSINFSKTPSSQAVWHAYLQEKYPAFRNLNAVQKIRVLESIDDYLNKSKNSNRRINIMTRNVLGTTDFTKIRNTLKLNRVATDDLFKAVFRGNLSDGTINKLAGKRS